MIRSRSADAEGTWASGTAPDNSTPYRDSVALFRRGRSEEPESVELVVAGNGVVVQGSPSAVTSFVDRIAELTKSSRPTRVFAEGLAVAGHVAAISRTYREYFEFAPRALKLLREHDAIPTGEGSFRSFVRTGPQANSPFAGHLDWKPVALGPEQALAMQTMVVHLALRAAINDVTAAVERVEGKVDKLVTLARAERLGSVIGDQLTLQSLAESTREHGSISKTDWSTVDGLGAQISRDIAALRAYVLSEVEDIETVSFARQRSAELQELTDGLIRESLALLVVAEQNYVLWQELRVAHVATHERRLLDQANRDVRAHLASLAKADQAVLDALCQVASDLLAPTGYEGFVLVTRGRLKQRGEALNETISWFANQRQLSASPLDVELPTLRESMGNARSALASGIDSAGATITSIVRSRGGDDEPNESSSMK